MRMVVTCERSWVPPYGHNRVSAWWGSTPHGEPPHRLSQPADLSQLLPGEQESTAMPLPRQDARPTRLISHIPAMGCVSVPIKGSLTLSKLCTAGSVALREQDGCQPVFGEKRGCSIQLAAEMGGQPGATVHQALLPVTPARAAGRVPQAGAEQEHVSEPPSSLKGKFIMETKAMLSPSGPFPILFPPELPAEVPLERVLTPRLGHAMGSRAGGVLCVLSMGVQNQRGSNPCTHTSTSQSVHVYPVQVQRASHVCAAAMLIQMMPVGGVAWLDMLGMASICARGG